uniref:Disease resistance protein At4g27190-like leucine-rich repeats domain-containing protein n=1 Tax=Lactuca sativa TaxID=4236 RepID=A0A9R1WGW6_LACSA|nr:hypothetical protein LSAT_V11C200053400 [Lactuca sativa]
MTLFSQVGGVSWTLCQYSREITIVSCNALSSVIPCYAVGQMQKLQVLNIIDCDGMKEVFETQGMNNNTNSNGGYEDGNDGTLAIPRVNNVIMLPNLKILEIMNCNLLEHIFKFSTLESLKHLEELTIRFCYKMKVIVQDDDGEKTTSSFKVVVFPHLKSITLEDLPELMGFFLGIDEFQWPSLDKVMIKYCPKMMVFAPGGSTAPQLKYIHTQLGKHSLECGLNFHVKTIAHHQTPLFPGLDSIGSFLATSEGIPWSFHNLIEAYMAYNQDVEKIFTSNEFLQLKKLENIHVSWCFLVEVFEAFEAQTNSSGVDESQTTIVKLPNLIQVELTELTYLRYIWKSNRWTIFEFPNLTRVSIEGCNMLEHVFTSSMVSSLLQLQDLYISRCDYIEEVIVKDENVVVQAQEEEESYGKVNDIVLHHLKSLELDSLRGLKGFWLGKENFSFPLLDTLIIKHCQAITTFTMGNLATPQLKEIEIDFDSYYVVGEDINSIIKSKLEVGKPF